MNDIEANQAYGALTEGLYVASFTFERAMARSLELLKSGGWRQVGTGFDDVNAFVRSLGLHQFKALADQRKEFAERVKELQPEVSNRAIAEALGVSHDTVNRDGGRNRPASTGNAQENRKWVDEIVQAQPTVSAMPRLSTTATRARSGGRKSSRRLPEATAACRLGSVTPSSMPTHRGDTSTHRWAVRTGRSRTITRRWRLRRSARSM